MNHSGFTPYTIVENKPINDRSVWISFDREIVATPGQFVMVWLPDVGEKPFSIAAMDPFSLVVVDVGPFSHALQGLSVGARLWIKGPIGVGFTLEERSITLVGGGYGAAPLLALATLAKKFDRQTDVFLGARSRGDLLLVERFKGLGCHLQLVTEDGSAGLSGLVTEAVEERLKQDDLQTIYACGPVGMLSALARLCTRYQCHYQLSWEAHMRCGMGLCGSCEVPQAYDPALPEGWLACYDGPVFRSVPQL